MFGELKTPVTPDRRPHSVSTAFKPVEYRRGTRCVVASNAVGML